MKTIAVFNSDGGVGKTTLVYHLAVMFAELGLRVVAADFDPQAHLTALSLPIETLEAIEDARLTSIDDVVAPLVRGGPPVFPEVIEVVDGFGLVPGDLDLTLAEDALSIAWVDGRDESPDVRTRGMRLIAAFGRAIRDAAEIYRADLALIDVGPNLGAINRAALLAADHVIAPVAPDIFSLKGLTNVGHRLSEWRHGWASRASETTTPSAGWPTGEMIPLGYVVSRFNPYRGDRARHFNRWINRVPEVFHRDVLGQAFPAPATVNEDEACLAWLKDYHSLMAMAHERRKPVFKLKPADGAIGGHQQAVAAAYQDFKALALVVARRAGVPLGDA
jgi:cellulose biosynthesis protein BcsQ